MKLPDVKRNAHDQIDRLEGQILGIVQIMTSDTGQVAVCVGGIPDVLIKVMAQAMKDNHQIKDLFETALYKANETGFNSGMN